MALKVYWRHFKKRTKVASITSQADFDEAMKLSENEQIYFSIYPWKETMHVYRPEVKEEIIGEGIKAPPISLPPMLKDTDELPSPPQFPTQKPGQVLHLGTQEPAKNHTSILGTLKSSFGFLRPKETIPTYSRLELAWPCSVCQKPGMWGDQRAMRIYCEDCRRKHDGSQRLEVQVVPPMP
jgi:hypothetical protein